MINFSLNMKTTIHAKQCTIPLRAHTGTHSPQVFIQYVHLRLYYYHKLITIDTKSSKTTASVLHSRRDRDVLHHHCFYHISPAGIIGTCTKCTEFSQHIMTKRLQQIRKTSCYIYAAIFCNSSEWTSDANAKNISFEVECPGVWSPTHR